MKLLAGAAGLNNFVRWVHIIEDIKAPVFLHGNELVFTTGIAQQGTTWLSEFIVNLHENNAAGLVVSIGPYVDSVPEQVIDYCQRSSMPLFTLPESVRLIDITYDFCHRIVASEENEVGLATAFINLIFEPQDDKAYRYTLEKRDFLENASYCLAALHILPDTQTEGELRSFKFLAHRILDKIANDFSLFIHDKRLIVVFKNYLPKQIDRFLTELRQSFTASYRDSRLFAGVSPAGQGYNYVTDGYHKAISALKVAEVRDEVCVYYQNLDLYKLLISVGSNEVLNEMYQESLGPLEKFDNENGTDYMDSLRCYLEHNSSVQEVAQLTFVHRNTINYKIRRIREILDCELTQENRLRFMLAFYIRDLL
jgi:hypothetical protein